MKGRRLYLAAYDVSEPANLIATLKSVRSHATGGQKSVYECFLNRQERTNLLSRVRSIIDITSDRFVLLALDPRSTFKTLGKGIPPLDEDFFYHG
jgi:CRISPR-associated protein Cas2|uniref:CRISPR-associated endoribonuclease Cas2 n=1 Tax=Leptospirillum ferrodiazotrophum TaxID=412449 RepID=C6I034_9BACT|nr:MAG: probable CRISPR-associated protein Cas2 [Leptospirillum ferrodiazotrophum]